MASPLIMMQTDPATKRRELMAAKMMNQGVSYKPLRHPLQAVAQVLQGGMGGYMDKKLNETADARKEAARKNMAAAMSVYGQSMDNGNPNAFTEMNEQLALNPDTADMGMENQMAGIQAQQAGQYKSPTYVTAFDPASPTGASLFDPRDMTTPVAPAPMKGKGTKINYSPDGGFELEMGGYDNPGMQAGKPTMNTIQGKLFDAQESLNNLNVIKASYDPRFSEVQTRMAANWSGLKAKWGLGEVSPEDRQLLSDYKDWQSASLASMNEYIKSITGAAMSEPEAKRILAAMPSAGQGIFDGDDPISFEAKLNSQIARTKLAIARYRYATQNGTNWRSMPLYKMRDIINERGAQVQEKLKQEGLTGEELDKQRRAILSKEFLI